VKCRPSGRPTKCAIARYHRSTKVIGKDAFDLYPRQLAEVSHADDQAVMVHGVVKNIEEPYLVGRQERWVHTVKVPYHDEQGHVVGVLVVLEDITERRALEAQYQQAQRMEGIGMLAGGVAHDFNNLLTAILGYSELLTEQIGPDKPMGRDLPEITAAAQRAAALTRQLLAFTRQQVLAAAPLNVTTVVRGLEAMLRRLLGDRSPSRRPSPPTSIRSWPMSSSCSNSW
jgi:two-component system cell cycle sensor histidine kinase/response regulator CckA